ncbi:MAG: hypothetical protein JNM80_03205 [Phycisphaerae bacterium]|nr:hypothetical protein [Phycisphaerae bacterium]
MKATVRALAFVLWCLTLLHASPPAHAQPCTSGWVPATGAPGVDGDLDAVLLWDPDGDGPAPDVLIASGEFRTAGSAAAQGLAVWDGGAWSTPFGAVDGRLAAAVRFGGRLVVGGAFTTIGGVPARNLAQWDGTRWLPLGDGTNGPINALAVFNDNLVVGGAFTIAGNLPDTSRVARWDGSAWHPLAGGMSGGQVASLATFQGHLYAAGSFSSAGGQPARLIARWNGATWSRLGDGIDTGVSIQSLTPFQGRLVAAGLFSASGAISLGNIAAWDGNTWTPFASGLPNGVAAVTIHDDQLFALAPSTGQSPHVFRWNGASWPLALSDDPHLRFDPLRTLASFRGSLILAGSGVSVPGSIYGGTRPAIAAYDQTGWRVLGNGLNARVRAFAEFRGEIIVAGDFSIGGTRASNLIARWTRDALLPLGPGLGRPAQNNRVNALAVFNDELIAAGSFSFAGAAPATGIAAWDGSTWRPLGDPFGPSPEINALLVHDGRLFAGGSGFPGNILQWNGSTWNALDSGVDGPVLALASSPAGLLVGGSFSNAGGLASRAAARWTGTAWIPMGIDASAANLAAFTEFRGRLYAAANCTCDTPPHLLEWTGSRWSVALSLTAVRLNALASFGHELILGGSLYWQGALHSILRWDGATLRPLALGTDLDVWALYPAKGRLLVGGDFKSAGGRTSYSWASWACQEPPACYPNCDSSSAPLLSAADFLCFQAAFVAGEGYANCDQSTAPPVLDIRDYLCFLNAFARGCP